MAKLHVKKGDTVRVLAGKDKGKEGEVLRCFPREGRVIVEQVNLIKKAMRPTQDNPNGGIQTKEAPMAVSNVMLVCPTCKEPSKTSIEIKNGKKSRKCKKCGSNV